MSDLFKEIMDDVRADNAHHLWKRYGKWVIYSAVAVVIITAVWVYREHARKQEAQANTAVYFQAVDKQTRGDAKGAISLLEGLNLSESSTFYSLVLLKKLQAYQTLNDAKNVDAMLAELAARNDVYGDMAKLLAGGKHTSEASALPYSTQEWKAWDLVSSGKPQEAASLFADLAKKDGVPESLRERALMLSQYLGAAEAKPAPANPVP